MKLPLAILRGLFGVVGAVLLVLGVLFWTGHALSLVQLHMTLGVLFVLLLWAVAAAGARAGAPAGLVVTTALWGLVVPALGFAQTRLLPGSSHWTVRVAHLLVGLVAMGLGGRLGVFIVGRSRSAAASPAGATGATQQRTA